MARIEKWDEVHGNQAPDERMMAFLDSATDQYAILQLRRSENTVYERFSSMRELERMGLEPDIDHYEVVYTAPLPLRELPLSASHIPSLPGRWAMQMTILSTRIFWISLILIRRLPPMCWELRSAKCPARSSGKLNARSEPMKEISRQKGAKTMMELNYTKNGDYLIPDIQLSVQEQKPLGK